MKNAYKNFINTKEPFIDKVKKITLQNKIINAEKQIEKINKCIYKAAKKRGVSLFFFW